MRINRVFVRSFQALILFPKDLSRRSGLKKVHANFNEVYHNINDVYVANIKNEKITGAIIGIYTKMCADAILRDKLFQKGTGRRHGSVGELH
jgi:hypothetical protein